MKRDLIFLLLLFMIIINSPIILAQKVLVVAPHPDDEILGVGGSIYEHLALGDQVKVIIMTNGDGYLLAEKLFHRSLFSSSDDLIKFGNTRREESIKALKVMGLAKTDLVFLNFPDGYLKDILFHTIRDPYFVVKLKTSHSPYSGFKVDYSQHELISRLEKIIKTYDPDLIYTPHLEDRHSDHWVTSLIVDLILSKNKLNIPQYQYLVHWPNYPQTLKLDKNLQLIEPSELGDKYNWISRSLTDRVINLKELALNEFKTQRLISRFLDSFLRKNELFAINHTRYIVENPNLRHFKEIILKDIKALEKNNFKKARTKIKELSLYNTKDKLYIKIKTTSLRNNKIVFYLLTPQQNNLIHKFSYNLNNNQWEQLNDNLYLQINKERFNYRDNIIVSTFLYGQRKILDRTGWYNIKLLK
ncbi:PIG-L deacetylase family protein [Orenia marismortui]|uniref:LmbE family N-acetylglucosaminyl deacetylase n=1 Tax=Orenia marismortui TaxID=46469 RepID=A0A4R8H579_9FIRM|nr:PIG-L family deacetylase [Orenia marismortui]TDX52309.1 LmbE family N-acetylglucosaminyl deacetylase [Orenia marismortui]